MQRFVHGVQLLRPAEPHDAQRAVGLDANLVRKVVVHGACSVYAARQAVGKPRIRWAMMFFWICEVPPMTLWARL
jgi:hypothetical protein